MLSDEERKAVDYLQLCYDLSTITNESLSKLGIVLNLIEKQSKEIEKLKKQDLSNSKIIANMSTRHFNDREKLRNSVSKDKIKPIQIIDLDRKIHNVYKIEEE